MEFFSFFCPYCYELEKIHNIEKLTKKNIKNITIQTYHVNFLGGEFSNVLTKSWIIAEQMGIEDKIMLPIFKGIQETHTIHNIDNIKKIFKKKASIDENIFDKFWNSITIEFIVQKKNKEIIQSQIDYIPLMLINGKYMVNYSTIENVFKNNFPKKYIQLIQFLIKKND